MSQPKKVRKQKPRRAKPKPTLMAALGLAPTKPLRGRRPGKVQRRTAGIKITPQKAAPVAKPFKMQATNPMIGWSTSCCPVAHGEYLQDIAVGANQTSMATITYNLNCALQDSFPWLGVIGGNWEYYSIDFMEFEYIPTMSTNKPGDVSMVINYDPRAASFTSIEQFMTYRGGVSGSLYNRSGCVLRVADEAKRKFYCRTGPQPSDTDIREYDAGNFQIRIDGAESVATVVTYGRLVVRYAVKFYTPTTNQSAESQMYWYQSGIVGMTRTANYGTDGLTYTNPTISWGGGWSNTSPDGPVNNPNNSPVTNGFWLDPGTWMVDYITQFASSVSPWTPGGTSTSGLAVDSAAAALLYANKTIDNIVNGSAAWNYVIRTVARTFVQWVFTAGTNTYSGGILSVSPGLQSWLSSFPGSALLDSQDLTPDVVSRLGLSRVYRKNYVPRTISDVSARLKRIEQQLSLELDDPDFKVESKEAYVHVSRATVRPFSPLESVGVVTTSTPRSSSKTKLNNG